MLLLVQSDCEHCLSPLWPGKHIIFIIALPHSPEAVLVEGYSSSVVLALTLCSADMCTTAQVWVSPVRPMVIEALLSFTKLEAVRLEAYSSLETACCFSALKHLPALTHLDLRLSGSHYALADNLDALHSLAKCLRLVSPSLCTHCCCCGGSQASWAAAY